MAEQRAAAERVDHAYCSTFSHARARERGCPKSGSERLTKRGLLVARSRTPRHGRRRTDELIAHRQTNRCSANKRFVILRTVEWGALRDVTFRLPARERAGRLVQTGTKATANGGSLPFPSAQAAGLPKADAGAARCNITSAALPQARLRHTWLRRCGRRSLPAARARRAARWHHRYRRSAGAGSRCRCVPAR